MAAGKSVADILAGAKETLNKANALSSSVEKEKAKVAPAPVPKAPTPQVNTTPPKHEYSNTPYSMASDAVKAIKARREAENKELQ